MQTNEFTLLLRCGLRLAILATFALSFLNTPTALAKTIGQEQETARDGPDDSDRLAAPNLISASDNANAEILQELESMRQRIQELEAQLKRQSVGATVQGTELKPQEAPPSQAFVHASGAQSQTGNETLAPTQSKPPRRSRLLSPTSPG